MIRKWTLKRNLVVVNVILLTVALLYSSIMLIRYSGEVSMKNLINSSYDMLTYVCRSVDDFITTEVKISTEVMQSDSDLKEHLEQKPEDYENQHEKLVDIYLMNRYLTRRNSYSRVSGVLAGIINKNGVVYNLQYPMDMAEEAEAFAESLMKDKKRLEYGYDWYPLQKNCFAPETGNLRNDSMIPVLKNLLLDGGGYQGTLIYSLSEEQIYEQYKKSKLLEEGYLYIVDREGRLISHSDESMLLHPEEVVNLAYTKKAMEGTGNYFIENREVVMSQRLNDGNWTAIAVIPLNNMIGEVIGIYKRFIFVIAVILIISVSVSVLLSREAIKPLETMIASMERVENGDFSVRVEEKGPYDIARLIHHYNTMLENTERYIREEYQIKRMKKAAELDALVAQINPHFFHNTLVTIRFMIQMEEYNEADRALLAFSKLLRKSFVNSQKIIPIREELAMVEDYLELMKLRYRDKFQWKILAAEDVMELGILKNVIQPLVENSISHGFNMKDDMGHIVICAYRIKESVIIEVEDDGVGVDLEKINNSIHNQQTVKAGDQLNGIGLSNIQMRILRNFGSQYGLSVEVNSSGGVTFRMNIPVIQMEGVNS